MADELELKAVVPDPALCIASLRRSGAVLRAHGILLDERWDTSDGRLEAADEVLRLRLFAGRAGATSSLDWKGPTRTDGGYKVREEIETAVSDAVAIRDILRRLGFEVVMTIHREIATFDIHGAHARLERYPRMDVLLEVEGDPTAIERAIGASGIPRSEFNTDRLVDFTLRYRARSGVDPVIAADWDRRRPEYAFDVGESRG